MATRLRIDRRFRGPPLSGNGGYVAGLLATELESSGCVVTLKAPPPLEEELRLERDPTGVSLWAGGKLIAEAARAEVDIDVPAPPRFTAAANAEQRFTGLHQHVFPGCFVCGPERPPGDGLRIFPGSLSQPDGNGVAATWLPDPTLGDRSGALKPEYVWSALDCPGYFAIEQTAGPAVLGRIGVTFFSRACVEDRIVITGWPIESSGRKHTVGTALHDDRGRLLAAAKAIWISISAPDWHQ